ncbi:hypothetical protein FRC08_013823 [Ceratobasidium sp. 394]|nr:hypothetical protein FRC08_013823 [Ceratobasidium sp. 394]
MIYCVLLLLCFLSYARPVYAQNSPSDSKSTFDPSAIVTPLCIGLVIICLLYLALSRRSKKAECLDDPLLPSSRPDRYPVLRDPSHTQYPSIPPPAYIPSSPRRQDTCNPPPSYKPSNSQLSC